MASTLINKTVIVTGTAGALGEAVTTAARAAGASVVEIDRAFDDPEKADTRRYELDLTDRDAVAAVLSRLGPFDAVFNVAGGFAMGAPAHDDHDDWTRMMAINVDTVRNMVAAAVPVLKQRGGGAIVNIGAYAAMGAAPEKSAYAASKRVVMTLTETLAEELRGDAINVNAVLPTVLDTPGNRAAMPDADPADWVRLDRLAEVMVFLASEAAGDIHGALIPVRGQS